MSARQETAHPHRVVVLVLPGVLPLDASIPAQVLSPRYGAPYEVVLAAPQAGLVRASGVFQLFVEHGLEALEQAETIIVPAYEDTEARPDAQVLAALRAAYERGVRIASICTGAFALAAAGLLDGRRATTHWRAVDELARRFPLVRLEREVLFVDEGQVLTSAGVAAGIDLCLYLVRRDYGVRLGAEVARNIVAAPYRDGGQAQYVPRNLPEDTGTVFARTRAWALEHLREPITVRDLAEYAHVSYRTFTRRFAEDTGISPLQWLLRARVDLARQLLEAGEASVDEVAQQCGLGSATNLRAHFRRIVGTTPTQYRAAFSLRNK